MSEIDWSKEFSWREGGSGISGPVNITVNNVIESPKFKEAIQDTVGKMAIPESELDKLIN